MAVFDYGQYFRPLPWPPYWPWNGALMHLTLVLTQLDLARCDRLMSGFNRHAAELGLVQVPWTPSGFIAADGRYILFSTLESAQ